MEQTRQCTCLVSVPKPTLALTTRLAVLSCSLHRRITHPHLFSLAWLSCDRASQEQTAGLQIGVALEPLDSLAKQPTAEAKEEEREMDSARGELR